MENEDDKGPEELPTEEAGEEPSEDITSEPSEGEDFQASSSEEEGFEGEASSGGDVNTIAILSYLGILVLIPLLVEKEDEFVQFHAKQGLVLLVGEAATSLLALLPVFGFFFQFLWIVWIALSVLGIVNVVNGKKKKIPVVGQFADQFEI